ncbi:MAG: hypothetical protein Q7K55_09305 [Candidatus Levybacteria bacterium]|nr:hypothetical protein [Candidatus Levybacteria bacterium]
MFKYKLLGLINFLAGILLLFTFVRSIYDAGFSWSFNTFVVVYLPDFVLLLLFLLNCFLFYKLIIKNDKSLSFFLYSILTFSTIYLFLFLFIGALFSANPFFLIFVFISIIGVYSITKKKSSKIALMLSFLTFLVTLVAYISSFEENYCWDKGTQADPTGLKMIIVTREGEKAIDNYNVKAGEQISVSFRAHMLCHKTFNFSNAIKEKYF